MHINSLRAVIYTQNQSSHFCFAPCTMAESRVHPALLLNAVLAKLLLSHLLVQWLKGLTPLCTAFVLKQGRKDHVCIIPFFYTRYRQMGDRHLLSHPTALCTQAGKSRACTTCPGSFTATLLCHSCYLAHIWELQTLYWLHSNFCQEGNNFRVQTKCKSTTPLLGFQ